MLKNLVLSDGSLLLQLSRKTPSPSVVSVSWMISPQNLYNCLYFHHWLLLLQLCALAVDTQRPVAAVDQGEPLGHRLAAQASASGVSRIDGVN